jgi:hypothetical protein
MRCNVKTLRHLGEHVGGHGALEVGRERDAHVEVEGLLNRRHAMAHVHLDRRSDRDMRAGVGGSFPGEIAHPRHKAIGAEFACLRERIEGRLHADCHNNVQRDTTSPVA